MRFFMPKAGFMSLFLVIPTLIGATPSNFDENTQFLIEKINIYVKNTQNGDYTKAIADFDTDDDDALDNDELWYALAAMDVGTYVTRSAWVKGIMDYFDSNSISRSQLLELTLTK